MRVLGIVFNSNREKKQKRPVEKKKIGLFPVLSKKCVRRKEIMVQNRANMCHIKVSQKCNERMPGERRI